MPLYFHPEQQPKYFVAGRSLSYADLNDPKKSGDLDDSVEPTAQATAGLTAQAQNLALASQLLQHVQNLDHWKYTNQLGPRFTPWLVELLHAFSAKVERIRGEGQRVPFHFAAWERAKLFERVQDALVEAWDREDAANTATTSWPWKVPLLGEGVVSVPNYFFNPLRWATAGKRRRSRKEIETLSAEVALNVSLHNATPSLENEFFWPFLAESMMNVEIPESVKDKSFSTAASSLLICKNG